MIFKRFRVVANVRKVNAIGAFAEKTFSLNSQFNLVKCPDQCVLKLNFNGYEVQNIVSVVPEEDS
ncbi:MAG: hypothetical protein LC723_12240 [Actinobacteria bacterium]|nr:hypothetical protein [Actinomycetota bacterium]